MLNIPKTKWDGDEEPTINLFSITLLADNFKYDLKCTNQPKPSAVFHMNRSQEKPYLSGRKLEYALDDRFG